MLYMVVERFKEGAMPEVYRRFHEKGRMMPKGLEYVSSWVNLDLRICYQLMETDDVMLFPIWVDAWRDLFEVEIVPVHTSAEIVQMMAEKD